MSVVSVSQHRAHPKAGQHVAVTTNNEPVVVDVVAAKVSAAALISTDSPVQPDPLCVMYKLARPLLLLSWLHRCQLRASKWSSTCSSLVRRSPLTKCLIKIQPL